uniref:Uncharacterized protein n=1 Tax=Glossina morsitans morsitans TaxID=37546 RepID=A0A1B0ETL0_GLOMM
MRVAISSRPGEWLLATAVADSTVKLWSYKHKENVLQCTQTIMLNRGFCFTLKLTRLPNAEQVLLAFSTDDRNIDLWVNSVDNQQTFQHVHKLKTISYACVEEMREKVLNNKSDICNVLDVGDIRMEECPVCKILVRHQRRLGFIRARRLDKTLIMWQFSKEEGIWMEKVCLGEVGGCSLGFFSGKFSSDGCSVLGHCYEGEYLLSVSADQTTRIHAPWRQLGCKRETWHELARPQVHGYDIQALALLTRYRYASRTQEKIVRIFQAPSNFVEKFKFISKVENDPEDLVLENLPEGASVPCLGLSNESVYNTPRGESLETSYIKDEYPENYFVSRSFETPPQEETLKQNTLWHTEALRTRL